MLYGARYFQTESVLDTDRTDLTKRMQIYYYDCLLQPDSTRDQDLRELIGGRRQDEARSYLRRRELAKGREGLVESEGEEEIFAPTTTVSSVVRLVERQVLLHGP